MTEGVDRRARIHVAGHAGLVGSALVRHLRGQGFDQLLLRDRQELDLGNQAEVDAFFARERPDVVFLAAARVGGIQANAQRPAEFIGHNLAIQTNVIHAAWKHGVSKLVFLGSSCIYPRDCPQPIREDYLLSGPLEPSNEWYAIAKIAGLKMCQAYRRQYGFDAICAMPTNLYGPGDNFHPEESHVLPALIRRFHEAARAGQDEVVLWGTGSPLREFLHVDDLAAALLHLAQCQEAPELVNIGSGQEVSILELAGIVARVTGFTGRITTDPTRLDGTPRKLLDSSRMSGLGWQPRIGLEAGIADTYAWFLSHQDQIRR